MSCPTGLHYLRAEVGDGYRNQSELREHGHGLYRRARVFGQRGERLRFIAISSGNATHSLIMICCESRLVSFAEHGKASFAVVDFGAVGGEGSGVSWDLAKFRDLSAPTRLVLVPPTLEA